MMSLVEVLQTVVEHDSLVGLRRVGCFWKYLLEMNCLCSALNIRLVTAHLEEAR